MSRELSAGSVAVFPWAARLRFCLPAPCWWLAGPFWAALQAGLELGGSSWAPSMSERWAVSLAQALSFSEKKVSSFSAALRLKREDLSMPRLGEEHT